MRNTTQCIQAAVLIYITLRDMRGYLLKLQECVKKSFKQHLRLIQNFFAIKETRLLPIDPDVAISILISSNQPVLH